MEFFDLFHFLALQVPVKSNCSSCKMQIECFRIVIFVRKGGWASTPGFLMDHNIFAFFINFSRFPRAHAARSIIFVVVGLNVTALQYWWAIFFWQGKVLNSFWVKDNSISK